MIANPKLTYRGKRRAFISFYDAVSCCLVKVQHRIKKRNLDVMKLATNEEHIIKEILV